MNNDRFWRGMRFALEYPDAFLAQQDTPGSHRPDVSLPEPQMLLKPGYLQPGYGGTKQWPFDYRKAKEEYGYRKGIARALMNRRFHPEWRREAREWMDLLFAEYMESGEPDYEEGDFWEWVKINNVY